MPFVLCVGALSLDTIFRLPVLPSGPGKFLPTETVEVVQGMAAAQAATIVQLGGHARLWASCGNDQVGGRMIEQLSDIGIDISALRKVDGARSGFASIFMDYSGERTIVPQYDPAIQSPPNELPFMDDVAAVSVDVRWPSAAAMALREARRRGVPGILDVEVAPLIVLEKLAPLASHIIASEAGARQLTGLEPATAAKDLAEKFRQTSTMVAVTAGDKGVFWSGGHIPPYRIEAVDTLAAGDVFHGAFAFCLTKGWEIEASLQFAGVAAALKCTKFGGRLGAPTYTAVIEALRNREPPS